MSAADRRIEVVVAGHRGNATSAARHLDDPDGSVRSAALSALARIGDLTDRQITDAFGDDDPAVRRQAAELAATHVSIDLLPLLGDGDPTVVEVAAWACGEQEAVGSHVIDRLVELTRHAPDPLVREAGAAALGAIGDVRGLPAIIGACTDKPHVRRRAVLALAPFEGDEVEAAIDRALADRDWQVRQAAEDLRRAAGTVDLG